jgi:hypothetical protein
LEMPSFTRTKTSWMNCGCLANNSLTCGSGCVGGGVGVCGDVGFGCGDVGFGCGDAGL